MKLEELKKLINKTVVQVLKEAPDKKIGPSKAYRWKEEIMSAVQDALYAHGPTINSQAELEAVIDEELEKIRADIETTLSMIGRSLYQVPYQVFKMEKSKNR